MFFHNFMYLTWIRKGLKHTQQKHITMDKRE